MATRLLPFSADIFT